MIPEAFPSTSVRAEDRGVLYDFDLRDGVQRLIYFHLYEREDLARLLPLIASAPEGSVFLDVGAHVGFYALNMARSSRGVCTIHAFEPDPRSFERLGENAALNGFEDRIVRHRAAVWNVNGSIDFYEGPTFEWGWGSVVRFADIAQSRSRIEAVTLDSFLAARGIESVALLKSDAEAAEIELLEGAKGALAAGVFEHVCIEFNGGRLNKRGYTLDAFLAPFRAAGYTPDPATDALLTRMTRGALRPDLTCRNLYFRAPGRGRRSTPVRSAPSR